VEILQLPAPTSLLSGEYPATELLSTVNSIIAQSVLSLPCRARLNCQPSINWVTDWRPFHISLLVFSSQVHIRLTTEVVKVKVTLRLAVYRQTISPGVKLLETHDQRLFFQLNSCGNSPYVTSSLMRWRVCLLWICLAFRQVYISHIDRVIENFFLLHYTQVLCQYRLSRANHAYLTYLKLQRQLIHLNNRKLDHRQV
jgi:hypothetical protein